MIPLGFLSFISKGGLSVFSLVLKLKYWRFIIPFIIAVITLSTSFVTSLDESIETGSFEPLIYEMGGRITSADLALIEDTQLILSSEGTFLSKINLIQKFIGDLFILYVIIYFFYFCNKLILGNTNPPLTIWFFTLVTYGFFHITFSLLFLQQLTYPLEGLIKSTWMILDYISTL